MSLMEAESHAVITSLQKNVRENPSDAWAFSRLGAAYHQAGFPQAAVEHLLKAIALVPDFPLPYRQLAVVYCAQGNLHLAEIYRGKARELSAKAKEQAERWRISVAL